MHNVIRMPWGLAVVVATLVGCYDLRGGSSSEAGVRDAADAADDTRLAPDIVYEDRPSPMDAIDGAPDAIGTTDAPADASIDLVDAAGDGSRDAVADVPATPDIVDAVADAGPPPCPTGLTRCGDVCVDTAVTPAHCGMCGTACPTRANAAPACVTGACRAVCNAGFADCDNDANNGCEAALERSENCGACGTRCQGGTPLCQESAGTYRCVSGCSGAASTRCGMSCVDAQTDVQHCGACDRACPIPTNGRATCAAGMCGFACNTGYHVCGATCAPDTAVETCGSQCSPCPSRPNATATCSAGSCGFACNAGFADCDGNASNGCEVDTRTTVTHCGACNRGCGTPANGRSTCAAGSCGIACNAGFANCDANATNGCETDLGAAATCGACDRACPVPPNGRATCAGGTCGIACNTGFHACGTSCADDTAAASCGTRCSPCPARANASATCAAGSCGFACNAGFADCDGDVSNGCESPLDSATSCGACGTRCQGSTPLCQESGGTYRCVSGCNGMAPTRCGASCVDPQTDLQHCGACDNACTVPTNGRATCTAGTCGVACNAGYHVCGTTCADDTAVATCGTQCSPCPTRANASARCTSGSCGFTCNAGFGDCDGNASNGCEVDTRTSTTHCGMCGRQCGPFNNADQACVNGACAIAMCHGATGDCNANIADGCEVLLTTNVTHCGRCGNACPSRANASTTCAAGTCGFTCNAGFADCDGDAANGCEVDLESSVTHCGGCGRACAAGRVCVTGSCHSFPSDGSEGAFAPTADVVLTPGVHNFTRVSIPAGVRVTTTGSGVLDLRATGPVVVAGLIDVSGAAGAGPSCLGGCPSFALSGGNTGNPLARGSNQLVGGAGGGGGSGGTGSPGVDGRQPDGLLGGRGGAMGGGGGGNTSSGGGGGGFAGGGGGATWMLVPAGCSRQFAMGGAGGGEGAGVGGTSYGQGGTGGNGGGFPYSGGTGASGRVGPFPGTPGCTTVYHAGAGGGGAIGLASAQDLRVASTFQPGSGGGGSGGGNGGGSGGGGGGGALRISSPVSITLETTGVLRSDGGDGGGIAEHDSGFAGAGGGSGGVVYLNSPSVIVMAGSVVSARGGSGGDGEAIGGNGGLGRIRVSVAPLRCSLLGTFTPGLVAGCALTPGTGTPGRAYIGEYPE